MSSSAFQDSAQATTTGGLTGNYSVTFASVRLGYIWTGSVQIPDALSSSVNPVKFTAFDSGIPIGSWYNDQSSGNLQVQQQLSVTASGLATGTYRAFFKGMITDAATTPPFWPGPTPAPPPGVPQTLVNLAGFLPGVGSSLLSAYSNQTAPVLLGTSLEVLLFEATVNSGRLIITWSLTALGPVTSQFTFDVPNDALLNPLTGLAQSISGLVLPNLGSFVRITAANATPATGTIDAIINTGLPPITRPPIIPGGILAGARFASIPVGETSFLLPPYIGLAVLAAEMQTPAANLDIRIESTDYLGTTAVIGPWPVATNVIAGNTATIGPFTVAIPPKICSLVIGNRSAAPATGSYSLIAVGP